MHQELVGEPVTALLCNDMVLLMQHRSGSPALKGSETSSTLSLAAATDPLVLTDEHAAKLVVKAVIALHSRDQVVVDGPTVRLRDSRSIYYLGAASESDAREWATMFQSA